MEALVAALAGYGVPGLTVGVMLLWLKRLQDRIDAEHAARLADAQGYATALKAAADERLADAKGYADRALALQEGVHTSIDKLSELVDLTLNSSSRPRQQSRRDE